MQTSELAIDLFDQISITAEQASKLMKAMANADRLLLLCQLSQGETSVGALESKLNLRQPSLSQQLTVLREAQLVNTRREGKNVFYSISSPAALAIIKVLHQEFGQNAG